LHFDFGINSILFFNGDFREKAALNSCVLVNIQGCYLKLVLLFARILLFDDKLLFECILLFERKLLFERELLFEHELLFERKLLFYK